MSASEWPLTTDYAAIAIIDPAPTQTIALASGL
jgi:hypothetical protein